MIACILFLIKPTISEQVRKSEWFNARDFLLASKAHIETAGGVIDRLHSGMSALYLKETETSDEAAVAGLMKNSNYLIASASRFFAATIQAGPAINTALSKLTTSREGKTAFDAFWAAWTSFTEAHKHLRESCRIDAATATVTDLEGLAAKAVKATDDLKSTFTLMMSSIDLPDALASQNADLPGKATTSFRSSVHATNKQCDAVLGGTVTLIDVSGADKLKWFADSCLERDDKVYLLLQARKSDDSIACPGLVAVDIPSVTMITPPSADSGIKKPSHTIAIVFVSVTSAVLVAAAIYIWYDKPIFTTSTRAVAA
jgi:hypothetical protein